MFSSFFISPIGRMHITASDAGITGVYFKEDEEQLPASNPNKWTTSCEEQLAAYFAGDLKKFDLPLAATGTPFQQQVWSYLISVPFGKTDTYGAIANALDNPLSIRAVGAANGKNPIAIIVPCHRIIGANGTLTGYAGGLWRKEFLLKHEGVTAFVQPTLF